MERRATRNRRGHNAVVEDMSSIIEEVAWEMDEPGPSKPLRGRPPGRPARTASIKAAQAFKTEPDDDVLTDAATEESAEEEGEDDDDDDESDDSDEGTYFIDQSGNYYYQATPDSDPVLTQPPKGKYVPEDDSGKTGDDAGISYVLIVDESGQADVKGETKKAAKSQSVTYHIDEGKNVLVEDDMDEEMEIEADGGLVLNEVVSSRAPIKVEGESRRQGRKKSPPAIAEPSSPGGLTEHNCLYCSYVTTKRHLLVRHMKCHSDDRPHKCVVCERGFKTAASLNNHVNTHTGTKPHHCKHCRSSFTTSGELVRHVRYKHTLEKPHKCTECDYASVELSKLRRHIRCHTGERPYQCPHCTYASPDTFKLKRHLRIHTGEKPYECDICQARFTQSNSMKAHKLIHNVGDKPMFKCEFCPTTCGRKTDLRIHIQKLHTSDNPLQCKKCNQSFPDRYTFKMHSKTHEGEKCYKCDYCAYRTMNTRQLDSHMLVHTDEKPFSCPSCDQTFRQKQLLKRHINVYHDPQYVAPKPREKTHRCPTCARGFHHKGNLIRHMAVHDPDSMGQDCLVVKEARKWTIAATSPDAITTNIPETYGFSDFDDEEEEYEGEGDDAEEEEDHGVDGMADANTIEVEHEDEDGNRYVVLEVIQNEDGELI